MRFSFFRQKIIFRKTDSRYFLKHKMGDISARNGILISLDAFFNGKESGRDPGATAVEILNGGNLGMSDLSGLDGSIFY